MAQDDVNIKFGAEISDLRAKMAEVTQLFDNSLANIQSKIVGITAAFAGLYGAHYLLKTAEETARFGDELARAAQKTGIAVNALQELRFAAMMNDVGAGSLDIAMRKLGMAMSSASDGTGKAADAFKKMGISTSELKSMKMDDVLIKVADAFSKHADDAAKSALAVELFGRSGRELIPLLNDGASGIEELRAKARELGVVMDDKTVAASQRLDDQLKMIHARSEAVHRQMGAAVMPVFIRLSQVWLDSAQSGGILHTVFEGIATILGTVIKVVSMVVEEFVVLGKTIAAVFGAITAGSPKEALAILSAGREDIKSTRLEYQKFREDLLKPLPPTQKEKEKSGRGSRPSFGLASDTTRDAVKQYEAELLAQKIAYAELDHGREMTKAEEKKFWDDKVELNRNNIAIIDELRKKSNAAGLAALKEEHKQELELDKMSVDEREKIALDGVEAGQKAADQALAMEQITVEQQLEIKRRYEAEKTRIQEEAQAERIAARLGDPNEDPVALQRELDKMAEIQRAGANKQVDIQNEVAKNNKKNWADALAPIKDALDGVVNGILQGTLTLQKALANIFQSIAISYAKMLIKKQIDHATAEAAMTGATVSGVAARLAAETMGIMKSVAMHAAAFLKQIASAAAAAFAGVVAFLSPIMGPWAVPAAVGISGAVLAAGARVVSSEGGEWDVPQDRLNFVHKNETILPAHIATPLRNMVEGGGGIGGNVTVNITAMDGADVKRFFDKHGSKLVDSLRGQARSFNTGFA